MIGKTAIYWGDKYGMKPGHKVQIRAIMPADGRYFADESMLDLWKPGPGDRVEVRPWISQEGRWSFVTCDPLLADVEVLP